MAYKAREEFQPVHEIISDIPETPDPLIVVVVVTKNAQNSSVKFPFGHGDWWIDHSVGRITCVFSSSGDEIPIDVNPEEGADGVKGILEFIELHSWPEAQAAKCILIFLCFIRFILCYLM